MIPHTEKEREWQLIAQIQVLEHGIAFFNCIKSRISVIREKAMLINTEDIKSDMRYNLGYIDALEWALNRPKEAQEILNNIEGV